MSSIYQNRYKRVEYIESSGTQYIDTGIRPSEHVMTLRIEADMQFVEVPTGTMQLLFGTGYYNSTATSRRAIAVGFYSTASNSKFAYMNGGNTYGTNLKAFTDSTLDANRHIFGIDQVNQNFIFDDKTQEFTTTVNSNLSNPILIFCGRQTSASGAPISYYSSARCYEFKVYDNDVLIADFVPVRDLYTSIVGLYDTVNETVVGNSGTGVFTYGAFMSEITADVSPSGAGEVTGSGFYAQGSTVQLEAFPLGRYSFVEWADGETSNPRTITVPNYDASYTAKFIKQAGEISNYFVLYGKKRRALNQKATFYSEVISAEINEDLLQTTTSTIVCLKDATSLEEGDVVFLKDNKDNRVFDGVIKSVEGNVLYVGQMASFYNINFYAMLDTSSEKTDYSPYTPVVMLRRYLRRITDGFLCSRTGLVLNDISTNFDMRGIYVDGSMWDSSIPTIPFRTESEVINMEDLIYEIYSQFGIIAYFDMKLGEYNYGSSNGSACHIFNAVNGFPEPQPAGGYYIYPYPEYTFGDNSEFLTNINVVSEGEGYNALMIFNSGGTTYRGGYAIVDYNGFGYYEFPGSVTEAPYRLRPTKIKVVNTDDTLTEVRDVELSLYQYNHKVNFTMNFKNNFYDFFDFKLGQKLNFYVGNKLYKSLLTGWKFSIESGKNLTSVDMTCGKVRTSLTSKLNRGK